MHVGTTAATSRASIHPSSCLLTVPPLSSFYSYSNYDSIRGPHHNVVTAHGLLRLVFAFAWTKLDWTELGPCHLTFMMICTSRDEFVFFFFFFYLVYKIIFYSFETIAVSPFSSTSFSSSLSYYCTHDVIEEEEEEKCAHGGTVLYFYTCEKKCTAVIRPCRLSPTAAPVQIIFLYRFLLVLLLHYSATVIYCPEVI